MGLIVIHVQVHMTDKDGTVLIVGNLSSIDSINTNANGFHKHEVPGNAEQAERFKQQVVRNTLDQMLQGAAQAREQMAKLPAASQRDVMMVLAGDFNLNREGMKAVLHDGGSRYQHLRCLSLADHMVGTPGPAQRDWVLTDMGLLVSVEMTPLILSKDNMHAAVIVDLSPFVAATVRGAASPMLTEALLRRLDDLRERLEMLKNASVKERELEDRQEELRNLVAKERDVRKQQRSAEEAGCFSLHAVVVVLDVVVRSCSLCGGAKSVILWYLPIAPAHCTFTPSHAMLKSRTGLPLPHRWGSPRWSCRCRLISRWSSSCARRSTGPSASGRHRKNFSNSCARA
jgi:hypothetical protein